MIVVDGNDGTGKTSLVRALKARGYEVADRGLPTRMTDDPALMPESTDPNVYVILDASVETSQKRLQLAGKDLTEKYHTKEDLTHYRERFLDVNRRLVSVLGPVRVLLVNSEDISADLVADSVDHYLARMVRF